MKVKLITRVNYYPDYHYYDIMKYGGLYYKDIINALLPKYMLINEVLAVFLQLYPELKDIIVQLRDPWINVKTNNTKIVPSMENLYTPEEDAVELNVAPFGQK